MFPFRLSTATRDDDDDDGAAALVVEWLVRIVPKTHSPEALQLGLNNLLSPLILDSSGLSPATYLLTEQKKTGKTVPALED